MSDSNNSMESIGGGSDSDSDSDSDSSNSSTSANDSDSSLSIPTVAGDDIAPELLENETSFDDEEDAKAFHNVSKYLYREVIVRLKTDWMQLFNYNFHSRLGDGGRARLGGFLAEAVNTSRGPVQFNLTFEEELPQSVGQVFKGPFEQDHALRRFKIKPGDDHALSNRIKFPLDDWRCLSQCLCKARSLRHLDLAHLSMGREELELLSSAIQGAKLKSLSLQDLTDEDDSLRVLLASINPSKLETVDIIGCDVGAAACEGLASILRNEETTLEIIYLDSNPIDDDCVRVLCESLAENRSLKTLHLNDIDSITEEGWKLFRKLVLDTSNLNTLYKSNHTLENVFGYPLPGTFGVNRREMDTVNEGHSKIIRFLARKQSQFDMEPFVDFDVKMMPFVMEFFQKFSYPGIRDAANAPLFYIYQFIRHWNMPVLFSFPSAEKARLSARINEVETINQGLLKKIEMLILENSRLTAEITELKSEKQSTGEIDPKSKRARPN